MLYCNSRNATLYTVLHSTQLNGNLKKQYVQSGVSATANVNGYYRQANISFPKAYKSSPHVVACLVITGTGRPDVELGCSVRNVSSTGCIIYVMSPEGGIEGKNFDVQWISVGEIN